MHTTREQLTWCACYQLDERLLFSTYTLLYHISPNGSNSFYLQKSCVWACVRLLWVYTTLNIQFTMKIHGENVCVCVLSLVRVDFRPKINYVFFSSGADARRYFSLFLLLHNGFFFVFSSGIVWAYSPNILRLAFSLSQNQRHHVLAVSQQVYWISSSSAFFASIKSLFFWGLWIVNCSHNPL